MRSLITAIVLFILYVLWVIAAHNGWNTAFYILSFVVLVAGFICIIISINDSK